MFNVFLLLEYAYELMCCTQLLCTSVESARKRVHSCEEYESLQEKLIQRIISFVTQWTEYQILYLWVSCCNGAFSGTL